MNLNILPVGDELQLRPEKVPRLTLRKMTNITQYDRHHINKHCTAGNFEEFKLPVNSSTLGVPEIRNLTCQEMRPVGECHVPDTSIAACQEKHGLGTSRAVYQWDGTRF